MNLVLKNRSLALMWLAENYHERRFYGNVKETIEKLLKSLRPIPIRNRVPKRVPRKRGYQDHGTLRPRECWRETHDYTFTELQNEIEEQRKTVEDTADLLEGWFF
jgi:hypothetical protein